MKTQCDGIQAPFETIDIKHELVYPSLKHEEVFSCVLCKMNPIVPEDLRKHKSIHLNEIISLFSRYLSCPEQIKCDICSTVIETLPLVILEMEQATNSNELCKYDELIQNLEGHQIYCDLYFKIFELTDYNRNIYDIHGANVDIERHKLINESLESTLNIPKMNKIFFKPEKVYTVNNNGKHVLAPLNDSSLSCTIQGKYNDKTFSKTSDEKQTNIEIINRESTCNSKTNIKTKTSENKSMTIVDLKKCNGLKLPLNSKLIGNNEKSLQEMSLKREIIFQQTRDKCTDGVGLKQKNYFRSDRSFLENHSFDSFENANKQSSEMFHDYITPLINVQPTNDLNMRLDDTNNYTLQETCLNKTSSGEKQLHDNKLVETNDSLECNTAHIDFQSNEDISIINAVNKIIIVDLLNKQKTEKENNNNNRNLQGKSTKRSFSQMNFNDEDELPLSILSKLNKQKLNVLNVEKLTPSMQVIKKMFMIKVNGNINHLKKINPHLDNQSKTDQNELASNKLNLQIKRSEEICKKLKTMSKFKLPKEPTVIIKRKTNVKNLLVLKQMQISKENKSENKTVNTIQQNKLTKLQSEKLPITDKIIKFVIARNIELVVYPIYDSSKLDKYLDLPKFNHLRDPLRSLRLQGMLKNCIMCMYTIETLDEFYCYSCNLEFRLESAFKNHLQVFTHKHAFNSDIMNLFIWKKKIVFDAKYDFNFNEVNIFNIIKEILQLNTFDDLVNLEMKYQTPSNVSVYSLNKILEEKNLISGVDCHVCGVKTDEHCYSMQHNNMANWYMAKCLFFTNMNNTEKLLSLTNQDIGNKNLYESTGTKLSISKESECNMPVGKCRICFKMVPIKEVADHLKCHIANQLYKCYICSKAFQYHSSLCMHIQSGIHYNYFRCMEENCIGVKYCFDVDNAHYHSSDSFDYRHSCGNF